MKRRLPLPIFVIALVIMLVIASTEYVYLNDKVNQAQSGIHITGNIKIIQNGLIVRNIQDAIQSEGGVDVIMCKVWNYTEACSNPNLNYGSSTNQLGAACQYWKGDVTPSLTNGFQGESLCNMNAIGISSDSSTVTTSTVCPSLYTTDGLAPAQAIDTYTSPFVSPSGIILTASFTPTASVSINKLCLVAWNVHSSTYSASTNAILNGNSAVYAFAIDLVSPGYTTTISTPFTVVWTIDISFS
jgi:hypothetical protein